MQNYNVLKTSFRHCSFCNHLHGTLHRTQLHTCWSFFVFQVEHFICCSFLSTLRLHTLKTIFLSLLSNFFYFQALFQSERHFMIYTFKIKLICKTTVEHWKNEPHDSGFLAKPNPSRKLGRNKRIEMKIFKIFDFAVYNRKLMLDKYNLQQMDLLKSK